jgi:hypothetical protein
MGIICDYSFTIWIADSKEATTKPTIDQEFEQYFSTLMM